MITIRTCAEFNHNDVTSSLGGMQGPAGSDSLECVQQVTLKKKHNMMIENSHQI
jgi:hypothetical protein